MTRPLTRFETKIVGPLQPFKVPSATKASSSWLNLNRLKLLFGETYQVSHQNHGLNGSTSTTQKLLGKWFIS